MFYQFCLVERGEMKKKSNNERNKRQFAAAGPKTKRNSIEKFLAPFPFNNIIEQKQQKKKNLIVF